MIRVLFVCCNQRDQAVYRYRTQHLAETLNETGEFDAECVFVGDGRISVAHDVVVLHRICDVWEGRQFANAARKVGATLVYAADDLVWDADALTYAGMEKMHAFAPRHLAMMHQANAVLLSTEYLAARARQMLPNPKPVFVARNFLGRELLRICEAARAWGEATRQERAARAAVTIGYLTGTATHDADLAAIAERLANLMKRSPNVKLLLVGPVTLPVPLQSVAAQVERRGLLPWRDLPRVLAADVDINIAPLDLTRDFNHGKSIIKFLEAGAVGVPSVASQSVEYRSVLWNRTALPCLMSDDFDFGEGTGIGRTAEEIARFGEHLSSWKGNTKEFGPDFIRLTESADARQTLADAAFAHVQTHATPDAHRDALAETFRTLAELTPARTESQRRPTARVNWPFAPKYAVKRVLSGMMRR